MGFASYREHIMETKAQNMKRWQVNRASSLPLDPHIAMKRAVDDVVNLAYRFNLDRVSLLDLLSLALDPQVNTQDIEPLINDLLAS